MDDGQLIQVIAGMWKGCIGSIDHHVSNNTYCVNLHRDITVVIRLVDMVIVVDDDVTVEYKDAQVASVDFILNAKQAALLHLASQVNELLEIKEVCKSGGNFAHTDRIRFGSS